MSSSPRVAYAAAQVLSHVAGTIAATVPAVQKPSAIDGDPASQAAPPATQAITVTPNRIQRSFPTIPQSVREL